MKKGAMTMPEMAASANTRQAVDNSQGNQFHFQEATRIQQSLLAPLERRCLRWLASGMPSWVVPDTLTVLGLFAMLMGGLSYALARYSPVWLWVVNFWLAVNWFGDSLDGTLARYRNPHTARHRKCVCLYKALRNLSGSQASVLRCGVRNRDHRNGSILDCLRIDKYGDSL
ncbi:MAG: hypothetical protein DMF61_12700 [Blastocatellia bacterium AA13]|nr:MAG: hypothetical protein DMF61_12700 [Blastocatellia bacterium AA13]